VHPRIRNPEIHLRSLFSFTMSLYELAPSRQSSLCLRSRSLLHNTLLKDQSLRDDDNRSTSSLPMALASPPTTPLRNVSAPKSDYSPSRPRHHVTPSRADRQHATDAYYSSPTSIPRRPHTATHTRDSSRSPLTTSDHLHPQLITPHEQVLRTRLERVLFSAGVADDTSKRRDERERGRTGLGLGASSANGSDRTIRRNRASTDPNIPQSPPPTASHFLRLAASSPSSKHPSVSRSGSPSRHKKRTSTGRSIGSASGSGSASCYGSASAKRSASGTTPPLVPDYGDHDEPRHLLLTPPSTPSPPAFGYYPVGQWSQCYRNDEDDDDEDDASCSSYSSSVASSPHPHQHPFQLRTPTSPHPPHTPLRPFNARRASAQCRAIEGYVSFANVEGLGVPDEPPSPHPHSQEKGAKGVLTALGWGGGVVRKILGGATEKAEDGVVY